MADHGGSDNRNCVFSFSGTTEVIIEALEGGVKTDASERKKCDWIKTAPHTHTPNFIAPGSRGFFFFNLSVCVCIFQF